VNRPKMAVELRTGSWEYIKIFPASPRIFVFSSGSSQSSSSASTSPSSWLSIAYASCHALHLIVSHCRLTDTLACFYSFSRRCVDPKKKTKTSCTVPKKVTTTELVSTAWTQTKLSEWLSHGTKTACEFIYSSFCGRPAFRLAITAALS